MALFKCRITSGKKSAKYGIRFSYPLYISLVAFGVFFENPYVLILGAIIALFGVILPMHPFDYAYNFAMSNLIGTKKIPGRGSEQQVNSIMAMIFNLGVIVLIIIGIKLNYTVMAMIYVAVSVLFITIQLSTNNFSVYSISNFLFRKHKQ